MAQKILGLSPEQCEQLEGALEQLKVLAGEDGKIDVDKLSAEQSAEMEQVIDVFNSAFSEANFDSGLTALIESNPEYLDAIKDARDNQGHYDFEKLAEIFERLEVEIPADVTAPDSAEKVDPVDGQKGKAENPVNDAATRDGGAAPDSEQPKKYEEMRARVAKEICADDPSRVDKICNQLCKAYKNGKDVDYGKANAAITFASKIDSKSIHEGLTREDLLDRKIDYDISKARYDAVKEKYHFTNFFVIIDRVALNINAYRAGSPGAADRFISGGQIAVDFLQIIRANPIDALIEIGLCKLLDMILEAREAKVDVKEQDGASVTREENKTPDTTIRENGTMIQGVDRETYAKEVAAAREGGSTTAGFVAGVDVSKEPKHTKDGVDYWRSGRADAITVAVKDKDGKKQSETLYVEKERVAYVAGNYYLVGPDGHGRVVAVNSPATLIDVDEQGRCYIKQCDTFLLEGNSKKVEGYAEELKVSKEEAVAKLVEKAENDYISTAKDKVEETIKALSGPNGAIQGKKDLVEGYKEQLQKLEAYRGKSDQIDKAIAKLEAAIEKTDAVISKMEGTLSRFEAAKEVFDKSDASFADKVDALAKAEEKASQADSWLDPLDASDKTDVVEALQEVDQIEQETKDTAAEEREAEPTVAEDNKTDDLVKSIEEKSTALSEKEGELKTALEVQDKAITDRAEAETGSKTERKEAEAALQDASNKVDEIKSKIDDLKEELKSAIDAFADKYSDSPDAVKFFQDLKDAVDNENGSVSAKDGFIELTERDDQSGMTTVRSFDKETGTIETTTVNSSGDVDKSEKLTPAVIDAIGKASIPENTTKEVGFLEVLKKYEPVKENISVVAEYLRSSDFDTKEKIGAVKDFCEWAQIDLSAYDNDFVDIFENDSVDVDTDDVETSLNEFLDAFLPEDDNNGSIVEVQSNDGD